ncbi:MAG: class I SAM-dependent methyltransferase [Bacteroidota bacterium]
MEFLRSATRERGVYYLSEYADAFESLYLSVREQEDRVLSDELVLKLPQTPKAFRWHREWNTRIHNFHRITAYVELRAFQSALDLGCGNGWFTARLRNQVPKVLGLDMNRPELEQACRLFTASNLEFAFADVFEAPLPLGHFDLITLNASVQYFPDFKALIHRLFELLAPEGEIHILDSQWYDPEKVRKAKLRSAAYYQSVGTPEMIEFYHHRVWSDLEGLAWDKLYEPKGFLSKIKRKWGRESMFPWIRIRKT